MKLTVRELFDLDYWDEYCKLTGTSVWAANEGQISSSDEVEIPDALVRRILGLGSVTPDLPQTLNTRENIGDFE